MAEHFPGTCQDPTNLQTPGLTMNKSIQRDREKQKVVLILNLKNLGVSVYMKVWAYIHVEGRH